MAEAAAALGQLGYGAGQVPSAAAPVAPAPTAPAAPAAAPANAAGDAAVASALASLGLTPGALANIPGLESLASVPGLESLLGLPSTPPVGVGIVPSRSRGKGKGFPPKGSKGVPKGGKLSLQASQPVFHSLLSTLITFPNLPGQDLPVLTSQEVQVRSSILDFWFAQITVRLSRSRGSSSRPPGRRTRRSAEPCLPTRPCRNSCRHTLPLCSTRFW